jgi:ABC-type glutathione transport system ATPase component
MVEPALDVAAQAIVVNLPADLCTELGLAIVFISHDLGIIGTRCDRATVMYAGQVVEEGPADAAPPRPSTPTPGRCCGPHRDSTDGTARRVRRHWKATPANPPEPST